MIAVSPPWRPVLALLCGLLLMTGRGALADGPVEAPRAVAVAETTLGIGAIVAGILSYTAWPGEARTIQVCVTRTAPDAAAILAQLEQGKPTRPLATRSIEPNQTVPGACDAVYFDAWTPEAQRASLRSLATRPVLTLGRGAEFCSDGGLFCLEPGSSTPGLRFEVNLDAVARSGLRVNPLVLRLARPRPASTS